MVEKHCFTLQPVTVKIHCAWLFCTKAETSAKHKEHPESCPGMKVTHWGTSGILAEDFSGEKKAVLLWSTFPRVTLFPVGAVKLHVGRSPIPGSEQEQPNTSYLGHHRGVLTRAKVQKTHWRIKNSVAPH